MSNKEFYIKFENQVYNFATHVDVDGAPRQYPLTSVMNLLLDLFSNLDLPRNRLNTISIYSSSDPPEEIYFAADLNTLIHGLDFNKPLVVRPKLMKPRNALGYKTQARFSSSSYTSDLIAGTGRISPEQVLMDFLGFEVGKSDIAYQRPSVTLKDKPTEEIGYIIPLMKFVAREDPAKALFSALDEYLHWKQTSLGEADKNIKFITVAGTSGKGKTTFARRFLELPYNGSHPVIVKDCKVTNRRYRVTCTRFDVFKDPETQLAIMILLEAFKYSSSSKNNDLKSILDNFYDHEPQLRDEERLVILNLDETNAILGSHMERDFFQKLLRILRDSAGSCTLVTLLSGTHSVDLFDQVKISQCSTVDIDLPLIDLEASKEIVLGMCSDPSEQVVSSYLSYLLTLCGGVGRYIEIAIIQMSIMGAFAKDQSSITRFRLDAYEYFLNHLQYSSSKIQELLENVTTAVLSRYPRVFQKFSKSIELLSCYTLFEWPVQRESVIDGFTVGDLEKEGLVFLQYDPNTMNYDCSVPLLLCFGKSSTKITPFVYLF